MENNKQQKINGSVFWWILLAMAGTALSYYYPLFLVFMAVTPALWAAAAFKSRPAVLGLLTLGSLGYGLLMGYGLVSSLLSTGFIAPAGILLYLLQKYRFGNFQTVMYTSVVLCFGLFLVISAPSLIGGGGAYDLIRQAMLESAELLKESEYMYALAREIANSVEDVALAYYYILSAFFALSNRLFLQAFNKKGDMDLCPMGPFGSWCAPARYVNFSCILMLVSTLLMYFSSWSYAVILGNISYVLCVLPLALTGANVLYALLGKKLQGKKRNAVFILLLAALTVMSIFVLAMLGFFAGMRRRRKEQP